MVGRFVVRCGVVGLIGDEGGVCVCVGGGGVLVVVFVVLVLVFVVLGVVLVVIEVVASHYCY